MGKGEDFEWGTNIICVLCGKGNVIKHKTGLVRMYNFSLISQSSGYHCEACGVEYHKLPRADFHKLLMKEN